MNTSHGRKTLSVSTPQAGILLLFNARDSMTVSEIHESTNIPMENLKKYLHTLCNKKHQILNGPFVEKPSEIQLEHIFCYNKSFKSKKTKIQIPLLMLKMTEADRDEVSKNVSDDRKQGMDAAIVRIMKARRKMSHNDLIVESIEQLKQYVDDECIYCSLSYKYLNFCWIL